MNMITKRIWLLIAIAVLILLVIAGAFLVGRSPEQNSEQSSANSPTSTPQSSSQPEKQLSTDVWGRQIEVVGDQGKPRADHVRKVSDACTQSERQRPLEDLKIQLAYGTQTVWSSEDGPTTTTDGFPDGYSRSPSGAALAAWNFYAISTAQGSAGQQVLVERTGLSETKKQETRELVAKAGTVPGSNPGAKYLAVPDAHRVLSCSDDLVVVELAKPLGADAQGPKDKYWQVFRFPMIWVGDHWELNGTQDGAIEQGTESGLNESWLPWHF